MSEVRETRKPGRPTKREERIREKMASREAFGPTRKLDAKPIPGMKLRWFNDKDNRIDQALRAGWEFVAIDSETLINPDAQEDLEKRKYRIVGTKPDGSPMNAYLMAIEEEIYAADQKAKEDRNNEIENQIKRAEHGAQSGEQAGYKRQADFKVSHE